MPETTKSKGTQAELAEIFGVTLDGLTDAERATCEPPPPPPPAPKKKLRPKIRYDATEVPRVARQVLKALAKHSADPDTPAGDVLFQRKRSLVILSRNQLDGKTISDEDGKPVDEDYHVTDDLLVEAIDPDSLLDITDRTVLLVVEKEIDERDDAGKKTGKTIVVDVPIPCPMKVIKAMMARIVRKDWKFQELRGCVETPTLRLPFGTLLNTPGYDEKSHLYYDPHGVAFPPIEERPTKEQCQDALVILKGVLADFPFADEDGVEGLSLSVALAAMLTAVVRRSLPIAPMFGFGANEVESGKTLLAEIIAIVMTGHRTGCRPFSDNEYQRETAIGAALDAGDGAILFDNADTPITGPAIERCLTEETFTTRRLGSNTGGDQIKAPTNALIMATGNHLTTAGDASGNRMLLSMIIPDAELKERQFKNPCGAGGLEDWVIKERPKLVAAALTILLGYIAAGRPVTSPNFRFKAWRKLVADALIWLKEADPCLSCQRVQDSDPVKEGQLAVMRAWEVRVGEKTTTTRDVVDSTEWTEGVDGGRRPPVFSELHKALADGAGVDHSKLTVKAATAFLKAMVGVRLDGWRLHKHGDGAKHAVRWQIRPVKPMNPWD
jgi:putative DNA primase/helicase